MRLCKETAKKVLAWRVISIMVASLLAWPFMDSFSRSLGVTLMLNVVMTVLHYKFEKVWAKWKGPSPWQRP